MPLLLYCLSCLYLTGAWSQIAPPLPLPGDLPIIERFRVSIPEPSDICFSPDGQHLYIVSDRGRLYKTDLTGEVIDRAKYRGSDFEGVCALGDRVYAVDETLRMILEFDAEKLKLKESRQYSYPGAANRCWESLVYLPEEAYFLAFTEKSPLLAHRFDDDLDLKEVYQIKDIREVAGATWHDGNLWLLSDEDRRVYRVDPKDLRVEASWRIPVWNPEGIAFSPEGELWVISDDMACIYKFKRPV